jgi:hypothetical protein
MFVIRTVLKPIVSSVRASTGTLIAQSGQAGVRITAWTPAWRNARATAGP